MPASAKPSERLRGRRRIGGLQRGSASRSSSAAKVMVQVRVAPEEHAHLRALAAGHRSSVSAVLRDLAMGHTPPSPPTVLPAIVDADVASKLVVLRRSLSEGMMLVKAHRSAGTLTERVVDQLEVRVTITLKEMDRIADALLRRLPPAEG
jgi:hypothetical protein